MAQRLRRVTVLLVALLPVTSLGSGWAATTTIQGSVEIVAPFFDAGAVPGPEVLKYINDGCHGNYSIAEFQAVLDLSAFRGHLARISITSADQQLGAGTLVVYGLNGCTTTDAATEGGIGMIRLGSASSGHPLNITALTSYMVINSAAQGSIGPSVVPNVNQHFKVELS